MAPPATPSTSLSARATRALWVVAGALALLAGLVGVLLPLVPTVPFLLLAALCFSRGCQRCERWLLEHPRFGPPLRDWREHRALPLRVKQGATLMMAGGAAIGWWLLPLSVCWLPAAACGLVAWWMWRLPTRPVDQPRQR